MSHSYEGHNGTKFAFNSDFSGPIDILRPDGSTSEVDGYDILELVLNRYLKPELVSVIEDVNFIQLFNKLQQLLRS